MIFQQALHLAIQTLYVVVQFLFSGLMGILAGCIALPQRLDLPIQAMDVVMQFLFSGLMGILAGCIALP
ncbi:MAG TPA: hypothetical protein PLB04_09360, partial [Nitrospira sp.]|nr:hypothetical protein [Nitrospira sp.]